MSSTKTNGNDDEDWRIFEILCEHDLKVSFPLLKKKYTKAKIILFNRVNKISSKLQYIYVGTKQITLSTKQTTKH